MADKKMFLNIQEQVAKNMKDIKDIQQGATVLAEFGIKVIGQVDDASELPDPAEYEAIGEYGDAYIVGTEEPYEYYIFTRAFEGQDDPSWFDLGVFPLPGPQGERGPQGYTPEIGANGNWFINGVDTNKPSRGIQGETGATGATGQTGSQGPQGIQGPQGPKGDPGSFSINGVVASADLLPSASSVGETTAYAVGTTTPYDIYVIMTISGEQEWLNIGPCLTAISDTFNIANVFTTSGTLTPEQLSQLLNDVNMNFIKIGNVLLVKSNNAIDGYLNYYSLLGKTLYLLAIDSGYGTWSLSLNTNLLVDNSDLIPASNNVNDIGTSSAKYKDIYASGVIYIPKIANDNLDFGSGSNLASRLRLSYNTLRPYSDKGISLGLSTHRFDGAFIDGNISDGTNSISVAQMVAKQDALPTTTTAGKVLKSTSTAGVFQLGDAANPLYIHNATIIASSEGPVISFAFISKTSTAAEDIGELMYALRSAVAFGRIIDGSFCNTACDPDEDRLSVGIYAQSNVFYCKVVTVNGVTRYTNPTLQSDTVTAY